MANQTNKVLLDLYKNYLNYFWLRPENAILSCFRALDFRNIVKKYIKNNQKILDISCGDGVFTFIALGGKLDIFFDAFKSIKNKKRTSKFDAYDYYDKNFKVKILKKPKYIIHTGTDWKNNLLRKSKKLNLYKKLIIHNNEKKFDFIDNSYDLVFSNSAYWVKNIHQHLLDMKRVTKVNGHIYLQMKFKDTFLSTLVKNNSKINFGRTFENIIDGGRLKTWKGIKTKKEFDKILGNINGLEVLSYKPLYGDLIALIWDIGFRPLFKPLFEMTNSLTKSKYIQIKREWVDILYSMSKKYISEYRPKRNSAMEYVILLKKNNEK